MEDEQALNQQEADDAEHQHKHPDYHEHCSLGLSVKIWQEQQPRVLLANISIGAPTG